MSGLDVFFLRTLSRVSFLTSRNLRLSPELNSKDLLKVLGSNPLGRLAIAEKIFLARLSAAWV